MQKSTIFDHLIVIAHRGDSDSAPENTIPAFDLALDRGFPAFETDCQLTRDGACVLLHCEQLGRTVQGSGRVADTTLEELQQLDAGSWLSTDYAGLKVPSLEEALLRYKGRAHIHLELKSQQPALPATVAALVQQHGWDFPASSFPTATAPTSTTLSAPDAVAGSRAAAAAGAPPPNAAVAGAGAAVAAAAGDGGGVGAGAPPPDAAAAPAGIPGSSGDPCASPAAQLAAVPGLTITSFHFEQLKRSKQLLPAVRHAWLIQEWAPDLADLARSVPLDVICPRANALTKEAVDDMKRQGFIVRAWKVNSPEMLLHVVACGADGATVDWPKKAEELLRAQASAH